MNFLKKLFSGSKPDGPSELARHWTFYRDWLQQKLPLYHSYLNPGADEDDIARLRAGFFFPLPEELIELYRLNDGDSSQSEDLPMGTFLQFEFLSIDHLLDAYNRQRAALAAHPELGDGARYTAYPEGVLRPAAFNPHWVPVFADGSGNFVGLDLAPGPNGVPGQVINFGRDEHFQFQVAPGLTPFLAFIRERIESGECDASIVEEDDGGYSYGLHPQSHLLDGLRHIIVEGKP